MKDKILEFVQKYGEVSVNQLVGELPVSRQYVHRVLAGLVRKGKLEKLGSPPRTFYRLRQQDLTPSVVEKITEEESVFLMENFLSFAETGERLNGAEGLSHWCRRQKLPYIKTVHEFIRTRKKYLAYFGENELISGIEKIKNTAGFSSIGLDELYYGDFYAIERFGKTKLGTLLHFAKQSQHIELIKEIAVYVKPALLNLIAASGVQAVGYIPPSIKRDIQFMHVLENALELALPHIQIVKAKGDIIVPQKALSKLEDRIQNARASIMVLERKHFEKILLIDDAIGSGATMNETALKLKNRELAKYIIGFAVTGSYKGFEVIQEV